MLKPGGALIMNTVARGGEQPIYSIINTLQSIFNKKQPNNNNNNNKKFKYYFSAK